MRGAVLVSGRIMIIVRASLMSYRLTAILSGTDMGNVTQILPGIHPMFNIGILNESFAYHTKEFEKQAATDVAHEATLKVAGALASVGVLVVLDEGVRRRVREDFERV